MIYKYRCKKCNNLFNIHCFVSERNKTKKCSCGNPAFRDVEEELKERGKLHNPEGDHPRWSWALAINPNQIKEAMKVHPDAVFNSKGQMLIKNRVEKLRRMKEAKMMEFS